MQRALLYALMAASFLLLGGEPVWTHPILLALVAAGIVAAPRRTFAFPARLRSLDISLVLLVLGVVVQATPLPSVVVDLLSPHSARLEGSLTYALNTPRSWRPLTIAMSDTWDALALIVIGIGTFWIARATFAEGHTRNFCRTITLAAGAAAVASLVQKFTTPTLLLGSFAPAGKNANPFGPFVNRNHFAAWLLMSASIAVGFLVAHVQIHPQYRQRFRTAFKYFLTSGALLSGIATFIVIVTLLLTLSRSAVAGLAAAAIAGGVLGRQRLRTGMVATPFKLIAIAVILLAGAAVLDVDGWTTRLQQSLTTRSEGLDRLTVWKETLPMIRDFAITGTGAGTFDLAMSFYQQSRVWIGAMSGWAHINNAHSHFVQVAAEGGLLLLLPVLWAMAATLTLATNAIRNDKGEMTWVRVGAAAGLIGVAVQSIWEISLTVPANSVLCGILAALALHRREAPVPPPVRIE